MQSAQFMPIKLLKPACLAHVYATLALNSLDLGFGTENTGTSQLAGLLD